MAVATLSNSDTTELLQQKNNGGCYFNQHWEKTAITTKKMNSGGYYFKQQWHSKTTCTSKQTLTTTVATLSNSDTTELHENETTNNNGCHLKQQWHRGATL